MAKRTTATFVRDEWVEPSPGWQEKANCRGKGHEAFFLTTSGGSVFTESVMCGLCPVRDECLSYGVLYSRKFGHWGGLSPEARTDLYRLAKRFKLRCEECGRWIITKSLRSTRHRLCDGCGERFKAEKAANRNLIKQARRPYEKPKDRSK